MREYEICSLARSKAGHDKGKVFVIVGETEDTVLLSDGKGRTLEHPKVKNRIHVQPITQLEKKLKQDLALIRGDEDIRFVLERYIREDS